MKTKMNYFQQGDVLIKPVTELPTGLVKTEDLVLQHGETTGHMHQFVKGAKVVVYQTPGIEGSVGTITPGFGKYIEVLENAFLVHEEHRPIEVRPGLYEIDIVREYYYEKDEVRRVVD